MQGVSYSPPTHSHPKNPGEDFLINYKSEKFDGKGLECSVFSLVLYCFVSDLPVVLF